MTQQPDDQMSAEFEAASESVRDARRFVTTTMDDWGATEQSADVALLTSELATNAVIHAQSRYTVTIVRLPDRVRVVVADGSPTIAHRRHYSPMSGTGRGLGMVADMAAAWGMEPTDRGKIVWFEIASGDSGRPDASAAAAATTTSGRTSAADVDVDLDALLADLGGWDEPTDGGGAVLLLAGATR